MPISDTVWAAKTAAAFLSSLEDHAFPSIGNIRVRPHIEASHIRDMLAPIWISKPEMARRSASGLGPAELLKLERLAIY